MPAHPRRRFLPAFALIVLAGMFAVSCTLVGQGDLHVANDESGLGADNTIFRAFAPDPGDVWPPAGSMNILVKGDDFGRPPSYGMDGYLYLVRTDLACPQSEGAPEAFTLSDVTITGIVTVTGGTVNQFLTMPDTPANRQARWALIEINELAGYPGLHLIHRCGTVTWTSGPSLVDACTLRTSLDGFALSTGRAFALDANTKWQFCYGGAAAGSNEKFLFRTANGGASWTLISRTTLGSPPAEPGVGDLPNGNGVSALSFPEASKGWLGLSSPGDNLYRSTDGGHDWTQVDVTGLDPGVPVLSITFTDAMHGTFTTSAGSWTTSNGGSTWTATVNGG
ncbi:MAG: YCF48-related protein [Dehalococcoidia bacterium]